MTRTPLFLLSTIFICAANPSFANSEAEASEIDQWFTFVWENDFIADDDSGYTNGLGAIWGKQSATMHPFSFYNQWAHWLPQFKQDQRHYSVSYRVAQTMYTPDDIEETDLIEDDRPYAGILQGSAHLQSYDQDQSWHYSATLGIVGPASGAEPVQKFIHEIIGVNQPKGWHHQLHNELAFKVSLEHLRRLYVHDHNGWEMDWIFIGGGDLGTLHSELGAGVGFRFGKALAYSFPGASVIPGRTLNPLSGALKNQWHAYINLYGRYVFNDLPIDGNTFEDSHAVTLKNEQAIISVGWAYNAVDWGMILSVQESSRTFEERRENTLFGTFALTFRY